jgi:hypothetical protein
MLRDLPSSVTVIALYNNQRAKSKTCYGDGEPIGKHWRPLQTASGDHSTDDNRKFFCFSDKRTKKFNILSFEAAYRIPANDGRAATQSCAAALSVARAARPYKFSLQVQNSYVNRDDI